MNMNLETEMTIVKSVYCRDGEFVGDVKSSCTMRRLSLDLRPLCLSLSIPQDYPSCPPHVTISHPILTRSEVAKLNNNLKIFYFDNYEESGMMLSIISWLIENVSTQVEATTEITRSSTSQVCIMTIDHMRCRDSYLKNLKKWSGQLQTNTLVLFCGKIILVTLKESDISIEEFIKRLRSRKVDIDSAGKPCKERMMSILCNEVYGLQYEVKFCVVELKDKAELSKFFLSMEKVYEDFIVPLIRDC